MEKDKKRIIIWGAIALLVVIILLWLMLRGSDIWQPENSTPVNENTSFIPPSKDLQYNPDAPPVLEETEFNVVNLAKDFAARFGSWSTDFGESEWISPHRRKQYMGQSGDWTSQKDCLPAETHKISNIL